MTDEARSGDGAPVATEEDGAPEGSGGGVGEALHFSRLAIRRMPGFPEGAFTLEEMAPGVNLVVGPNASGKSTTARALQAILWPESAPARARLTAAFGLDGEWRVDLDGRHVLWHRDGTESDPPPVPAAEVRHRYDLSLQELLAEEDRELARRIVLESQGGFDVDQAARELEFRENHGSPRRAVEAFRTAHQRWDEVRRYEEDLRKEEARLRDLEEERDRARTAQVQLRWLECLEERARARRDLEDARRALEPFPEAMERLRPDDGKELEEARQSLRSWTEEEARAREDARRAREERDATGLPEEGIPERLRPELSEDLRRVQEQERRVEEVRRELEGARARRGEAARPLGIGAEGSPAHLTASELEEVDRVVRRREELLLKRENRRERLEGLPVFSAEDATHQQELDEVVGLLREWLRLGGVTSGGRRRVRRWSRTASALSAASAGGFVALPFVEAVHPLWAAGAVVPALALLAVERALMASETLGGSEDARRQAIEMHVFDAGVGAPDRWDPGNVGDLLRRLEGEREELRRKEVASRERSSLNREISEIETRLAEVERERTELVSRISVPPDHEDLSVHWLAGAMGSWWRAHEEVVERHEALEYAEGASAEALRVLTEKLREGVGPVEGAAWRDGEALADAAAAAAALDDLDRRVEDHRRAAGHLAEAERRASDAAERIRETEARARGILERLGLGEEDDAVVHRWLESMDDYREADRAVREAEVRLREVEARLEDMGSPPALEDLPVPGEAAASGEPATEAVAPGAEVAGSSSHAGPERAALLEDAPPEAVADVRPILAERASGIEELQERIGDIRGRLERAREKHDREVALAGLREAGQALLRRREEEEASVVGARLAGWLHRETRDHARPPVFRKARANFEALTHRRYRLELDEAGEGEEAFRAVDQTTGLGHALDELSDGTRVQLLLSVRLAFVEAQEQGAALPLFLDEVLANADDHRALEVMRAVAAMAEGGRQVFYFTAQREEVARWEAVLSDFPDVSRTVLDLARARSHGTPERVDPPPPAPVEAPPSPDGEDHGAYGRRLQVPPVHSREPVERVHIWYLVEDVGALHALLSLGLERWGQLRGYVDGAGEEALPPGAAPFARLRGRAAAAGAYLEAWREGRGRPVDRGALEESGAVSERFFEEVDGIRQEMGGDAEALLEALREGRVKGFRQRNREALEVHFRNEGHLAASKPNSPEELRQRAIMAGRAEDPELPPEEVDRILTRLSGVEAGP